ncbi:MULTISPECIES: hypothetical protein [unclassified Pseudomonas]|uniref:hypothetical protein n=1 Tax=unclassified Pseudomonas TaxID=196821 RepID=UPI00215D1360|nr:MULTISPECIES: hypothetical protein [unclassified Pseudomonas]MCR8932383.1 hypothetical protein [Pseudomonas sp. S11A4]MCR8975988.1 hypothetical protein [Pseudomonas sp. S11P7]
MKYLLFLICLFTSSANAMSGQALVLDLNNKYSSNVANCSNGTPAYYCSGVLLRAVDYSTFFKFWDYGSKATELGSVAFTYIRSDIGSRALNGGRKSGFILKDQTSALAQDKALNVRCIYPFPTESLDVRVDHGCGFAPRVEEANADLANCAKLAVPATTAAAWLANFREHDSLPRNQCSLSTLVAGQFKASLEAHELVDADWTAKPMEVLVQIWDESKPEKLPLEAVFYDASTPAKLADAQNFQRDYYQATSLYVPIVKLDMSAGVAQPFSFSNADQVFGEQVAQSLNARYAATSDDCAGRAAYFCNGVLIRSARGTPSYHVWDPSDSSVARNGVSFSYLRKDLRMDSLYIGEGQAFIFKNYDSAIKAAAHVPPVRCAFPTDGATANREQSCGHHIDYPDDAESCLAIGVDTLDKWKTHFHQAPNDGTRYYRQCSLSAEKQQFSIFLKGRNNFQNMNNLDWANEVIIAAWPRGIPEMLPIEAFVYVSTAPAAAKAGAQFMQSDYFNQTGDFLPVIKLTFAGEDAVFSYHPEDQVVQ